MLEQSVIAMDTNCLLLLIEDFINGDKYIKKLQSIADKIYIPFVIQVEYYDNFEKKQKETRNKIASLDTLVSQIIEKDCSLLTRSSQDRSEIDFISLDILIDNLFAPMLENIEQIKNNNPIVDLSTLQKFKGEFLEKMRKVFKEQINVEILNESVKNEVASLIDRHKLIKYQKNDLYKEYNKLCDYMDSLLENVHLGELYHRERLNDYLDLIIKRYEHHKSPGYEDFKRKKDEIIMLGSSVVPRSYSDAIFWLDTLSYYKKSDVTDQKYLIVLSDEKKRDWVYDDNPSKVNVDMFVECFQETGLILKKRAILDFLNEALEVSKEDIDQSKILLYPYSYVLYGHEYEAKTQVEMMEKIFQSIISNINIEEYIEVPCIKLEHDDTWLTNSIFNSNFLATDIMGQRIRIGTTLNLKDKLGYICRLLEIRHQKSSSNLKFVDKELQQQWEDVCQKKNRK